VYGGAAGINAGYPGFGDSIGIVADLLFHLAVFFMGAIGKNGTSILKVDGIGLRAHPRDAAKGGYNDFLIEHACKF